MRTSAATVFDLDQITAPDGNQEFQWKRRHPAEPLPLIPGAPFTPLVPPGRDTFDRWITEQITHAFGVPPDLLPPVTQ